ncbi:MAG: hypothetical protein MJZ13_04620 [Bacteroidales bacterium]|nr:hypothetical protein [Bacteroidales bacterium]
MRKHIISLFAISSFLCACGTDLLNNYPEEVIEIDTSVPEVSSLKLTAIVTDTTLNVTIDKDSFKGKENALPISRRGICYSFTESNPRLDNSEVVEAETGYGNIKGQYSVPDITYKNLKPGTKLYICSFAENARGISYSDVQEVRCYDAFSRLKLVNRLGSGNSSIRENYSTSAHLIMTNTIVLQVPGDIVVEQGVCYSEKENPTIDDAHAVLYMADGYPTESGIAIINGLKPSTTYHLRAFAKHSGDNIIYSDDLAIKTRDGIPSLSIKGFGGVFKGMIREDGGNIYLQRGGFCYSKDHMPTIEDAYTTPVDFESREVSWSMYDVEDKLEKGTKYLVRFFTFEDPLEYDENGSAKPLPAVTSEYLATKEIYYSDPMAFEYN